MAHGMYETILVPTDGSDGANRAVEHALDLAEHYDAAVHAMFVVDTHYYGEPALSSTEIVLDEIGDEGMDLLHEVADRGERQGIPVETKCCQGAPSVEILGYAEEIDADLIALGHRGTAHQELMGSVTDRVVRAGRRPILVV